MVTIKDKVLDPYSIEHDGYQYVLKVRQKKDKSHHLYKGGGDDFSEVKLGFYITLKTALHAAVRHKMANKESVVGLKEYLNEYKNIIESLNSVFDV